MSENGITLGSEQQSGLAQITAASVDMQVATAKRYPRSIAKSLRDAIGMATITKETAASCLYALPRAGKTITGPSVRTAEIAMNTWGNLRCEGRLVEEGEKFVTAQGVVWDMEQNVLVSAEVRRSITTKLGKRFSSDMVTTTINAAVSIALRNAAFRVIPRSIIDQIYNAAKSAAVGNIKTLGERRAGALASLASFGITQERVLARLEKHGIEDVGLEDIETLIGLYNSVSDEEITPDEAFPEPKIDIEPTPKAEARPKPKEKVTVEKTDDRPKVEVIDNTATAPTGPITLEEIGQEATDAFIPPIRFDAMKSEAGVKNKGTPRQLDKLLMIVRAFVDGQ